MIKSDFKKYITCFFLLFFSVFLFSEEEKNIDTFSNIIKEISLVGADDLLKKNAFPKFLGDSYSKGKLPIPVRENRYSIKKISALFKNKKIVENNKFKTSFLNYLKTSNNSPLICFLTTTFLRNNPSNDFFVEKILSILVDKTQKAKTKDKWKYLFMIEQLLRGICYTPKLDAYIIKKLDKLYPHTGFPIDKEMKTMLTDLYGKDAVAELKRTVPKKQEYDTNAYTQLTFILFAYIYFKKDELRKHIEYTKKQREEMRNPTE